MSAELLLREPLGERLLGAGDFPLSLGGEGAGVVLPAPAGASAWLGLHDGQLFLQPVPDATSVLDACDREQRMSAGKRPTILIYQVICTDHDAMHWAEEDIGNLRVALNALVRVFRL